MNAYTLKHSKNKQTFKLKWRNLYYKKTDKIKIKPKKSLCFINV